MCRMMGVVGARESAQPLAARFRLEASQGRVARGASKGHADGWGLVQTMPDGSLRHAGLSPLDAASDPQYPLAIAQLGQGAPRGVLLAHVRKATAGAKTLANTHPFIEEGYAFCHNGTVEGYAPEGASDSRALFASLLAEIRKGASEEDAIATLARDVDARFRYTSLTFLLTDGRSLWGLRRIGNDPNYCSPDACPQDYYTLGHATLPDGSVVVSQEHEVLGIAGWKGVPDGGIVTVNPDGEVRVRSAF